VRLKGGDPDRDFTAVVTQSEPASVSSVVIAGEPELHKTLTASATTSGNPPPTVRFQWLRCSGDPLPCNPIDDATRASYGVVDADVGKRLIVSATATNSSGTDMRQSEPTSPVQAPPRVTSVGISGQALIGDRLTATATATGFPAPTIDYRWLRCPVDPETDCQPIADATDPSYVVEALDAAHTLVARAIATNPAGADAARSAPTAAVPEPGLGDVFEQLGAAPVSGTLGTSTRRARARYLRPFPVVRIKGVLVVGGARVTLLRVKAPRRSIVNVRCRRSGCRLRGRNIGVGRVQALERFLRAGASITIRVRKRNFIGKYVRIVIRDGRPPARRDACLLPGKRKPVTCPRL